MLYIFYCREGHITVIDCLLENDPHLWKTKSKNGRTPLHTAGMQIFFFLCYSNVIFKNSIYVFLCIAKYFHKE